MNPAALAPARHVGGGLRVPGRSANPFVVRVRYQRLLLSVRVRLSAWIIWPGYQEAPQRGPTGTSASLVAQDHSLQKQTILLEGFLGTYISQISQSPEGKEKLRLICVLILPQMAGQDESRRFPRAMRSMALADPHREDARKMPLSGCPFGFCCCCRCFYRWEIIHPPGEPRRWQCHRTSRGPAQKVRNKIKIHNVEPEQKVEIAQEWGKERARCSSVISEAANQNEKPVKTRTF